MRGLALVALVLVLGALPAPARAEGTSLPLPVLDGPGLRIHKVETACNTYLLTCTKSRQFVVVDPGFGIGNLVLAYTKAGHRLTGVWITHEHGDHVAGLGALAKTHDVAIVAHAEAKKGLARVRANWESWGMQAQAPIPPALPDTVVADGDRVKVGQLTWTVRHLPGHSPGSVGFILPGRVLVAGDVLFQGSIGRTDFPTGDKSAFEKTLGTLWGLGDATMVLPGHGETTTIGTEKKTNWLFQDFVRAGRGEAPIPRPWLGIEIDTGYAGKGIRMQAVVHDSPAKKAGLQAGDTILVADGTTLVSGRSLMEVIRRHAVGDTIPLQIQRGSERKTIRLQFGARRPR